MLIYIFGFFLFKYFIGGYANGVSAHGSQSDGDSVNTTVCYLFLFLLFYLLSEVFV